MTTARRGRRRTERSDKSGVAVYGSELWRIADALWGSMDAAEYKQVVQGLIFFK